MFCIFPLDKPNYVPISKGKQSLSFSEFCPRPLIPSNFREQPDPEHIQHTNFKQTSADAGINTPCLWYLMEQYLRFTWHSPLIGPYTGFLKEHGPYTPFQYKLQAPFPVAQALHPLFFICNSHLLVNSVSTFSSSYWNSVLREAKDPLDWSCRILSWALWPCLHRSHSITRTVFFGYR